MEVGRNKSKETRMAKVEKIRFADPDSAIYSTRLFVGSRHLGSMPDSTLVAREPIKWPDKGYVLASENGKSLWPYLEASFIRDGYQALSPERIRESRDVE